MYVYTLDSILINTHLHLLLRESHLFVPCRICCLTHHAVQYGLYMKLCFTNSFTANWHILHKLYSRVQHWTEFNLIVYQHKS